MDTDNIPVKLDLTLKEVNKILSALSDKPFREVSELIQSIHQQATPQVVKATNNGQDAPTPSGKRSVPKEED